MKISRKKIIQWGLPGGAWLDDAVSLADQLTRIGNTEQDIKKWLMKMAPIAPLDVSPRASAVPFQRLVEQQTDEEIQTIASVLTHMDVLLRTPTIVRAAVMPDTAPAGMDLGTMPVGSVVATRAAIHPDFHSADICCSMFVSIFTQKHDVGTVLDAALRVTHFGSAPREKSTRGDVELELLTSTFKNNPFLHGLESYATDYFMTQGDGNHFLFVGEIESTGEMAIVTHHGSRALGARLCKRGRSAAENHVKAHAPTILPHHAWIPADTRNGDDYWAALQTVRSWTKLNHAAIHRELAACVGARVKDQFWAEHNFVFRRSDGLFYHAKGATPSFAGFSSDDSGTSLIALNMAEPILIASHANNDAALGFAPHGAGRSISRNGHIKRLKAEFGVLGPSEIAEIVRRETVGLDVRFYSGVPDISELPSSYNRPDHIVAQIGKYRLANVGDRILPWGSLMSGQAVRNVESTVPQPAPPEHSGIGVLN